MFKKYYFLFDPKTHIKGALTDSPAYLPQEWTSGKITSCVQVK